MPKDQSSMTINEWHKRLEKRNQGKAAASASLPACSAFISFGCYIRIIGDY